MGVYDWVDANIFGGQLPWGAPTEAQQQQLAMPGLQAQQPLAAAAPRGRIVTLKARLLPGQAPQPISITPGGVALYSRDITAANRLKRVQKKINRLFPRPRRYYGKKKR